MPWQLKVMERAFSRWCGFINLHSTQWGTAIQPLVKDWKVTYTPLWEVIQLQHPGIFTHGFNVNKQILILYCFFSQWQQCSNKRHWLWKKNLTLYESWKLVCLMLKVNYWFNWEFWFLVPSCLCSYTRLGLKALKITWQHLNVEAADLHRSGLGFLDRTLRHTVYLFEKIYSPLSEKEKRHIWEK